MTIAPDAPARRLDWRGLGVCAQAGRKPEMWDADRGTKDATEARRLCLELCPVRIKCLAFHLELEGNAPPKYRHGVAGGLDSNERYRLARERKTTQQEVAA